MSPNTLNISSLLHEVARRRRQENIANVFKVFGIVALATIVAWLAMIGFGLGQPHTFKDATSGIGLIVLTIIWITFKVAVNFVILFWPILLYFWANVMVVRQRTLLSLIQTALETGTPLSEMIRAYAAGCFSWYAARLQRFAAALDTGSSFEQAVKGNWGLFRYDVAGMIRLGGDEPETLRAIEDVAQDERDFSMFRTSQTVRVVYLSILAVYMMMIMSGIFIFIVPQFEKIFKDFDTSLPALTLYVCLTAQVFVRYWYLLMPPIWCIGLFFLVYLVLQTNVAVFRPLGFRRIFRNTDAAKFLILFAVGIRHRFPIPAILEMYRWTVPSAYLRRKGKRIQTAVEKGRDWIDAVRRAGFVSGAEASLLQSAERTGNTATVLDQLARSKERSQIREDDLVSKMVFIPLVFVLGAVVGAFAVGMFLPLVKLITALS